MSQKGKSGAPQWTPGPWFNVGPLGYAVGVYAETIQIAAVYGPTSNPGAIANANLIAAAPDLYGALKEAAEFIAEELQVRMQSFLPDAAEDESGYIGSAERALAMANAALAKARRESSLAQPQTPEAPSASLRESPESSS